MIGDVILYHSSTLWLFNGKYFKYEIKHDFGGKKRKIYLKRPSFGIFVEFLKQVLSVEIGPFIDGFRMKLNFSQLSVKLEHRRFSGPDVALDGHDERLRVRVHRRVPKDLVPSTNLDGVKEI